MLPVPSACLFILFVFLFVVCMRNDAKTDKWYKYGDHKLKTTSGRRVLWIECRLCACVCVCQCARIDVQVDSCEKLPTNTNRHNYFFSFFTYTSLICFVCYLLYLVLQIEHDFCNCHLYFCMFQNFFRWPWTQLNWWNQRRKIYETVLLLFTRTHRKKTD